MSNINELPILIVPISLLPNTTIKRYFKVSIQTASFNVSFPEIRIGGFVLHKIETIDPISNLPIEIDAPGIKNYYKEFTANNNEKVDINGHLDENGEYGQYNWIYWMTYDKVISPQEAIIGAVLEADTLNKFN
jgi:hypothetical protein